MGSLLVELVPFAVGLVVTPAAIAAVLLLLASDRPVANGSAFTGAFALVYGLLTAAALAVSSSTTGPLLSQRTKAWVALAVGLVLLVAGLHGFLRRGRPDAAGGPGWMARLDVIRPGATFGLGAVLAVANPNVAILLGGLSVVVASGLPAGAEIVGGAFLVAASVVALAGCTIAYVAAPDRLAGVLNRAKDWLVRHQRVVNSSVLLVFGALFVVKGLLGL